MTTSNATMTPTGEDASAAAMHRALKQDEMTNTQDLFEAVLTRDNLTRAWKRVKSNHGAPGIDGITVDNFAAHAREHWPALHEQLKVGDTNRKPCVGSKSPSPTAANGCWASRRSLTA